MPLFSDALSVARALAPMVSSRAMETERLGTLPSDMVSELRGAGLFGLAVPKTLGGAELPPPVIVEVVEELCRADGSIGWTVLVGNGTAFLAWLDPDVAVELLDGRADTISSTIFAPTGALTPTGAGRFTLAGHWAFGSGCRHADWFVNGAVVSDANGLRLVPGHGPDVRLVVFPADRAEINDTWDAAGLRGTGSHDVLARRVSVRPEHTMSPHWESARHDGPLWRLPLFTLAGVLMAGFPLGVGRRALDELAALAPTKIRQPSTAPIAADGDLQVALARAEGGLRAARSYIFETAGSLWEQACRGDVPSTDRRADFLLAAQQAMWAAKVAVDTAFGFAGAGALRLDHPVQRCFRDLHAATQHIFFTPASAKGYAKNRLGIDQPDTWF
jgi:indole-3-acetate monooxygenase